MENDEEHTFAPDATHSLRNRSLSVHAVRGPDAPRVTVLDLKPGYGYPIAWGIAILSDGGWEEASR